MDVWRAVEAGLAPYAGRVLWGRDDLGSAIVFVRRDLAHLDADALNDRLHAWSSREVEPRVRGASAFVSFRNARPASEDEAEWGVQAEWLGLEPTFRLELHLPPPTAAEVRAFLDAVPAFLAEIQKRGRPAGWRDVEAGNAE